MNLHCILVDDEPLARKGLEDYIQDIDFLELAGSFRNAVEAHGFLTEQEVDLVFLDIKMPKLSGIDFWKSLKNPPMVIFTTAYREYAVEGFELDAIDYLVKPIAFDRFFKAANKAKSVWKERKGSVNASPNSPADTDWFFIKEDSQFIRIHKADILFVESLKDYVFIHTQEKRHMALLSLKQVEESLGGGRFLRVHRSYLVALDQVKAMEGNQLLIGQHRIPISKNSREEVYGKLVEGKLWKRE